MNLINPNQPYVQQWTVEQLDVGRDVFITRSGSVLLENVKLIPYSDSRNKMTYVGVLGEFEMTSSGAAKVESLQDLDDLLEKTVFEFAERYGERIPGR